MYGLSEDLAQDKQSSTVREEINANLKRVYSDALNEDVPDRLKQLIEELRRKEGGK